MADRDSESENEVTPQPDFNAFLERSIEEEREKRHRPSPTSSAPVIQGVVGSPFSEFQALDTPNEPVSPDEPEASESLGQDTLNVWHNGQPATRVFECGPPQPL